MIRAGKYRGGDARRTRRGKPKSNMVAASRSVFSPGLKYPDGSSGQGKLSYAHALEEKPKFLPGCQPDSGYEWEPVPWHGPELGQERVDKLKAKKWRPKTVEPTMPYRDANRNHGPIYSHGFRPEAPYTRRVRHFNKRRPGFGKCQKGTNRKISFGKRSFDNMSISKLTSMIMNELRLDEWPDTKIHPGHKKIRVNKAIKRHFTNPVKEKKRLVRSKI